jgi:hypothetical protein
LRAVEPDGDRAVVGEVDGHRRAEAAGRDLEAGLAQALPSEFGALCAFICGTQTSYITGQNFLIDGGLILAPTDRRAAPPAVRISAGSLARGARERTLCAHLARVPPTAPREASPARRIAGSAPGA